MYKVMYTTSTVYVLKCEVQNLDGVAHKPGLAPRRAQFLGASQNCMRETGAVWKINKMAEIRCMDIKVGSVFVSS